MNKSAVDVLNAVEGSKSTFFGSRDKQSASNPLRWEEDYLLVKGIFVLAFSISDLSVLAYAQGFTLWHYKAGPDKLIEVSSCGFFNLAADMLASGDMMMVSSPEGGRMLCIATCQSHVLTAALA